MDYIIYTSLISGLGASFVLLRRVHENRMTGVEDIPVDDAYWPLNVIWEFVSEKVKIFLNYLASLFAPHAKKAIGTVAGKLHKATFAASDRFLKIANLVHGKGSLKRNAGQTSIFIRDISEYKKRASKI